MKRKLFLVCTAIILLLSTCLWVCAAAPLVVDHADLLTPDENAELTEYLELSRDSLGMDVVVLTVTTLDGKSAMEYADDYYDQNGYDYDGILLLVCMNEREYWISTSGDGIFAFADAELDEMGSRLVPYLQSEDYLNGFAGFAEDVLTYGMNDGDDEEVGFLGILFVALGIGAGVGFIVVFIMKAQMKSVRRENTASNYAVTGSFHLSSNSDIYLYRNVTKREKPQDNGGSSTHRGSSGRSHGGRGGSF